ETEIEQEELMFTTRNTVRNMAAFAALLIIGAAASHARAQGLVAWGKDSDGQVSDTPAGTFSAVSAGYAHCVAIRPDGTLISWGYDGPGQVSGIPTGTFSAFSAGGSGHCVAIRTDGTLVAWWNDDRFSQVSDTPAGTFTAVSAGDYHNIAIRTDGKLAVW